MPAATAEKTASRSKSGRPAPVRAVNPGIQTIAAKDVNFDVLNAYLVEITPDDAAAWLDRNTGNRAARKSNSKKLIQDVREGNFMLTGETIIFDKNGVLLNGQHRLGAAVETDMPIVSFVVTGIEPQAQSGMDAGAIRTLADNIQMQYDLGKFASVNLAAAVIITYAWEKGLRTNDGSGELTIKKALAWLGDHPELIDLSADATRTAAKVPALTSKQVAAFIWTLDKIDQDDRRAFFDKLATGIGLEEGDPILVLRSILQREESKRASTGKMHPVVRMAVTAKAWNAWRDGVKVKTLAYRGGGTKGETFPEPH